MIGKIVKGTSFSGCVNYVPLTILPIILELFYELGNLLGDGPTLISHTIKTVNVGSFGKLIQVRAFANQFTDDVNIFSCNPFAYCTMFDERTHYFALTAFTGSAECSEPAELFVCKTDCNCIFLVHTICF